MKSQPLHTVLLGLRQLQGLWIGVKIGATTIAGRPFGLRVGLLVASIGGVARTVSIAIHFGNVIAIGPKQQLLSHFRKASAAILAIEVVE